MEFFLKNPLKGNKKYTTPQSKGKKTGETSNTNSNTTDEYIRWKDYPKVNALQKEKQKHVKLQHRHQEETFEEKQQLASAKKKQKVEFKAEEDE